MFRKMERERQKEGREKESNFYTLSKRLWTASLWEYAFKGCYQEIKYTDQVKVQS